MGNRNIVRHLATRRRRQKPDLVRCLGGPFGGHKIALSGPEYTTAVFTVGEFTGYYQQGQWRPAAATREESRA